MPKSALVILSAAVLCMALVSHAFAFGEDVLAHTGQYTFFIKPEPGSHVTYYQKMVPCVADVPVPVPRRVVPVYPLPMARVQTEPVSISETPVGCALGQGPCVDCFPQPSQRVEPKGVVVPRDIPISVPGIEPVPRCVKRPVLLLQWFEVREDPLPREQIQRVRAPRYGALRVPPSSTGSRLKHHAQPR